MSQWGAQASQSARATTLLTRGERSVRCISEAYAEPVDAPGLLLRGVDVLDVLALVGHRSDALEVRDPGARAISAASIVVPLRGRPPMNTNRCASTGSATA